MLASFTVRNSKVTMDGKDVSGISNNLEVSMSATITKIVGEQVPDALTTLVKHKSYVRKSDIDELDVLLNTAKSYSFSREALQYTLDEIEIFLSKDEAIAGVVPIELIVSSIKKPTRTRISK